MMSSLFSKPIESRISSGPKDAVDLATCSKTSYKAYVPGHEYLPIYQGTLQANPNLVGNSANNSTSNADYFSQKGWTVHPIHGK